jgi:hypothetical protein
MDLESAYEVESYPPKIWSEANYRWSTLTEAERAQRVAELREEFEAAVDLFRQEGVKSTIGFVDVIFFGLALVTAFGVGSGGQFGD